MKVGGRAPYSDSGTTGCGISPSQMLGLTGVGAAMT